MAVNLESKAVLTEASLAAVLLITSIVSVKSSASWHSVLRVIGSALYLAFSCVLLGGMVFSPSTIPDWCSRLNPEVVLWVIVFGSLFGLALFTIGYLAQVLTESTKMKEGTPNPPPQKV